MKRPEEYANRTSFEILNLTSKDGKVYSCSPGVIKAVDRKDSLINVYVVYKNYFIVYKRLAASKLKEGAGICEGQLIGSVDVSKSFWFSVSKDDLPVDPKSILTCEVKR